MSKEADHFKLDKRMCCVCEERADGESFVQKKDKAARLFPDKPAFALGKRLHDACYKEILRTGKGQKRPKTLSQAQVETKTEVAAAAEKPVNVCFAKAKPADAPVIAFCLFRKTARETDFNYGFMTYVHMLKELVRHFKISDTLQVFRTVVYIDPTVEKKVRDQLLAAGVDEIKTPDPVPEHLARFPGFSGTLMRYWAFVDYAKITSHVVALDADLPFSAQLPKVLVNWYSGSNGKEDVLRATLDCYKKQKKNFPLMGGLFGLAHDALREIGGAFLSILESHPEDFKECLYEDDQHWLAKRIFPLLKHKYSFLTLAFVGEDSLPKPKKTQLAKWKVKRDKIYADRSIALGELL